MAVHSRADHTTRATLMKEAALMLRVAGPGQEDYEALKKLVVTFAKEGEKGVLLAYSMAQSGNTQAQFLALYRWAEGGFPVLSMGHKYAAALCCTTASKEAVDHARPPFHGYVIELPEGIVSMTDPHTGAADDVRLILVVRNDNNVRTKTGWSWAYTALSTKGYILYRCGVSSAELLPPDIEGATLEGGIGRSYLVTENDQRACAIIGRLVVNTALAMSDPSRVPSTGGKVRHKMSNPFTGRAEPEPTARTYVLGRDVVLKHDLRPEVRRYLAGERKSLSVQVLVSGHYKMQPHGPGSSLRKLIWRQPFWRGPEDAPIPIRSHVLGGEP